MLLEEGLREMYFAVGYLDVSSDDGIEVKTRLLPGTEENLYNKQNCAGTAGDGRMSTQI